MLLASSLFSKIVQDMEVNFNMTIWKKVVFGCLRASHAKYFLLVIPIDGLGQHMSLVWYHTILRYYLHYFPLMRFAKRAWINLESMQFIVGSFRASNIYMILSGMFFVIFFSVHGYL
jgi:hypothetical protein